MKDFYLSEYYPSWKDAAVSFLAWLSLFLVLNLMTMYLAWTDHHPFHKLRTFLNVQFRQCSMMEYVVPLIAQTIIPVLFFFERRRYFDLAFPFFPSLPFWAAYSDQQAHDWWYGSPEATAPPKGQLLILIGGYFLADTILHGKRFHILVLLHHILGVINVIVSMRCMFRGVWIGVTVLMEFGTICMNLAEIFPSYTGAVQPIVLMTSVVPTLWGFEAVCRYWGQGVGLSECFLAVGTLIVATGRIKENWKTYKDWLQQKEMRDAGFKAEGTGKEPLLAADES